MAIAFDAAVDADYGNVVSGSHSHTCSGSDRKLLCFLGLRGDDADIATPTVTYAGVSMTMIGAGQTSEAIGNITMYAFQLTAPTTGANTLAYTLSIAPGSTVIGATLSFTGVDQGSAYDAQGGYGANSVTNVTAASDLTTIAANAWVIDGIMIRNNSTITVDASQTQRTTQTSGGITVMATSTKGPIVVPASTSMDWTWTTTHRVATKFVSLAPAVVGGSGHISKLAGAPKGLAA